MSKITGYRQLSQSEIDAINSVKELEADIAKLHAQIGTVEGVDKRWLAIARSDFERACMALTRSIAKPASPFEASAT